MGTISRKDLSSYLVECLPVFFHSIIACGPLQITISQGQHKHQGETFSHDSPKGLSVVCSNVFEMFFPPDIQNINYNDALI